MNFPIVLASFTWPLFKQLLVVGIVVGSTYALLGVSFSVIYATTRVFHFAHAVVYAGTAYIVVLLGKEVGLPWVLAMLGAIAFAIVLGVSIDRGVYRPMRMRQGTLLAVFLASLGLTIVGPNLIQLIFGPNTKLFQPLSVHSYNIGSTTFTSVDIITVVVCWVCIIGTLLFLSRTKYGIATLAMRTNEEMAAAVGISPDRITALVFALGSALVAVPALLYMLNHGASPGMGLAPVLTGFIAVFLGGVGRTGGAALGGFLIGLITSLSGLWLDQDWQPAVVFGILFILLIVRPRGILSGAGA
jgi:branched-chain amino acid transport system permease protein